MRVLHVIDSAGMYGAEAMLLTLVTEQMKLGYRSAIASIGAKGEGLKPFEKEATRRGIEVLPFRMRNGLNILGAYNLLKNAYAGNFEILHSHGYKGNILLGLMLGLLRRLPLVSTVHGWTNTEPFSRLRLYEALDAVSLRFVDAVVVVNHTMINNQRLRSIPRKRVHVIENGIPELKLAQVVDHDQKIIEFCKQRWTVVNIGRLTKEKGHIDLIKAFSQLINQGVDANLLIIGEGPERQNLEAQIVALGMGSQVYIPGYCGDAWNYLPFCGVFVLTSLTEGLPITLLEAIQMEIPVIASAVGGIPRVITHGLSGLLVSPRDTVGICDAMRTIYQDKQLARSMVECSLAKVRQSYMSSRMARAYQDVYCELKEKTGADVCR